MAKSEKNLTVFGQETEFDGVLEFSDNLIITGKFHGTIKATGDLEIDKSAFCEVDTIQAHSVQISGHVTGNVDAEERIELHNGSKVKGNLTAARLRIADNVEYEGQITMTDKVPEEDIFSVASEEYKKSLIMNTTEVN